MLRTIRLKLNINDYWMRAKGSLTFRTLKRIWVQTRWVALVAIGYAATVEWFAQSPFSVRRFIEKFFATLAFLMWYVIFYFRVQSQLLNEDRSGLLRDINEGVKTLLEQAAVQNANERATESTKSKAELQVEYQDSQSQIMQMLTKGSFGLDAMARRYTAIADAFAEKNLDKALTVPIRIDHLTISELQNVHRAIFPSGYALAGKVRTIPVVISRAGATALGAEPGSLKTSDPREVGGALEELLDFWNRQYPTLSQSTVADKLDKLARFHHRFSAIHPFLDGNGRINRVLLARQTKALFGKDIDIAALGNNPDYVQALRAGDRGNFKPLSELIGHLL